jgi:glutaconate CoA-transferase, subunit A
MPKLMSMRDAVRRVVPDGATVACGLAFEAAIPFAFTHEIIRQGRRRLSLVGPISDMAFDQLVGAGCVAAIEAAWVGNVTTGAGHCFRRAVEAQQPRALAVREHTNYTIALALRAGASGVGYLPTRTALGSDIATNHDGFAVVACPFSGDRHLAVRAIRPDVTVVHVQRADANGNAQAWGNVGVSAEAIGAADRIVVVCEELVDTAVIEEQPNLTLVPGRLVDAVVHEPGGTHPSPLLGYGDHDAAAYQAYGEASRTAAGFQRWLEEWVLEPPDRAAYLRKVRA